jgi:hypothetical protein
VRPGVAGCEFLHLPDTHHGFGKSATNWVRAAAASISVSGDDHFWAVACSAEINDTGGNGHSRQAAAFLSSDEPAIDH